MRYIYFLEKISFLFTYGVFNLEDKLWREKWIKDCVGSEKEVKIEYIQCSVFGIE